MGRVRCQEGLWAILAIAPDGMALQSPVTQDKYLEVGGFLGQAYSRAYLRYLGLRSYVVSRFIFGRILQIRRAVWLPSVVDLNGLAIRSATAIRLEEWMRSEFVYEEEGACIRPRPWFPF